MLNLGLLLALAAHPASPQAQEAVDTIYWGGPMLTMVDEAPAVEALAVREGRIVAAGERATIEALRAPSTRVVDLDGKTLLPGFVDSHGHLMGVGFQSLCANLLAAPDGDGNDIASVQTLLREWADANPDLVGTYRAIVGFGWDESQLAEGRAPNRDDLDAVTTDLPVYIIHTSGHLGVANSKALEQYGFTSESEDPPGGVIRRRAGSREPDGVLEELAHFAIVFPLLEQDDEFEERMLLAGIEAYASFGFTTGQEGRATDSQVDTMARVAARDGLPIDVVAYPDFFTARAALDLEVHRRTHVGGFRVGGAKFGIDGSPQGKTAWRDRPYHVQPEGVNPAYCGYPAYEPEALSAGIAECYERGWQLLGHANGEAAIDALIANVAAAQAAHPGQDLRSVLIHGQFLRADQVPRIDALGIFPSLFPMHTFYWGDWHREQTRGPVMADDISPTGWLLARGMRFGTHHDAPVALPDSMRVLDATVTRRSRTGDILGAEHRVPVWQALQAMTIWPAYQHFEEADKGTLEVGKLADFVLLSGNPLEVDPETLDRLEVRRTIKRDQVVYQAE